MSFAVQSLLVVCVVMTLTTRVADWVWLITICLLLIVALILLVVFVGKAVAIETLRPLWTRRRLLGSIQFVVNIAGRLRRRMLVSTQPSLVPPSILQ